MVKDHSAPAGRLMLHCLRISLPSLPHAAAEEWDPPETPASGGNTSEDQENSGNVINSLVGRSSEERVSLETLGDNRVQGQENSRNVISCSAGPLSEERGSLETLGDNRMRGKENSGNVGSSSAERLYEERVGTEGGRDENDSCFVSESEGGLRKGLEVFCPPPDDMVRFLNSLPWWKEGLLEEAERSAGPLKKKT